MAYTTAEGQAQLLDSLAASAGELAAALAALGAAYEQLDERTGNAVEEELFRPVQRAYGRAKAVHADFCARNGLSGRDFPAPGTRAPASGPRALLDDALARARAADAVLAKLQDSMLPVEVGDRELRSGLEQVRSLLGSIPRHTREIERTLGR